METWLLNVVVWSVSGVASRMCPRNLLNYQQDVKYQPDFKVTYEMIGNLGTFISTKMFEETKRFVGYAIQLFQIDSVKSKYKSLVVQFERTDSREYDGAVFDSHDRGIIKVFIYEKIHNVRALLTTISHELIHVKQYCDKRLAKIFKKKDGQVVGCFNWSNETMKQEFLVDEVNQSYMNMPWEVEAYKFQSRIVDLYHEFLRDTKKTPLLL